MKLGILVAQSEEASPTLLEGLAFLEAEDKIVWAVSGVGKLNASYATMKLIDDGADIIINLGVVAGRGSLNIGDLVVVDRVYDGDFDVTVFDHPKYYVPSVGNYLGSVESSSLDSIREYSKGLRHLPCFSISQFLDGSIDTEIKDYIVDMEYYGIAHVCYRRNIPVYSIKCVSDTSIINNDIEYEANLIPCSEKLADYILPWLGTLVSNTF